MKTKIFFGSNVKFLRTRQKYTQEHLAQSLSMSRSKLNCIEAGQTKSPSIEDMLKFSAHFKMTLDTLIKIDLSQLGELKLRELEAGNDIYIKGGNLRVLAITVDKDNNEHVEYVPVKAKAGYQAGYNDPAFISSLPRYSVPNLPRQGTFRIFPTEGDSMLPIPEGSDVTGEYVENWQHLKDQTPCIVVLKNNQDFVFKLVTFQKDKTFLLESMNPVFGPYTVAPDDVLEIWKFHSFTSKEIPEPVSDMGMVLQELRALKEELRGRN
ncbi:MAG: helix-turn-helix domain-containing protein [Moheibacter sp.]